ncbi:MAG: ion transporter [Alphaproteobacteria bacterium]|nr:ion transporter [Alphaproteobacteria bacterium SS10]
MHSDTSTFRHRLYLALEDEVPKRAPARILHWFIIVMITVSVGAVILETVPSLNARFGDGFHLIERIAVFVFAIEYIARVWVSVEHRHAAYRHPIKGRLRYALTPMALVDLIAFLPSLLTLFGTSGLYSIRLLRMARMLKIMRYSPALRTLSNAMHSERRAAFAVIMIMVMALTVVSTLMWILEREAQPEAFASIPAAMWWGMATLTTIGYGDVVPVTPLGKLLGGVTALFGVGMFALPAGILASGFVREMNRQDFRVTFGVVADVPLFAGLDQNIIADVTERLQPRTVPPRYAIIRKGEEPDRLYFVETGEVEIALPLAPVRVFSSGQLFGAVDLVDGAHRPQLSATSITETRLLELPLHDFVDLIERHPDLRTAALKAAKTEDGSLVFEGAEEAIKRIEAREGAHMKGVS